MAADIPEDMLYWPAADVSPLEISLRHLRSSDLVILLIAHRYGNPPTGHNVSITELEFNEAVKLRLPVLAFRVDPDYPWPPRHIEKDPEVQARLDRFLREVKRTV